MKVGIFGYGNMGSGLALCIGKTVGRENTVIYDIDESKRNKAVEDGFGSAIDPYFLCDVSDIILIAVKPADVNSLLRDISGRIREKLIVSIVAGLSTEKIASLTGGKRIIRVMPNVNVLVGKGTIAYTCGEGVSNEDEEIFLKVFSGCGDIFKIKEDLMNSFTALCGSGPAFVSQFVRALNLAGVREGFDSQTSLKLVLSLVEGTVTLMKEKGMDPDDIVYMVSSPGGTTIEGVRYMEEKGFGGLVINTVREARRRAENIG